MKYMYSSSTYGSVFGHASRDEVAQISDRLRHNKSIVNFSVLLEDDEALTGYRWYLLWTRTVNVPAYLSDGLAAFRSSGLL